VAAIESGLTVEGKTFKIAEQMAHYSVPGVSIVVVVDGYRIDWANACGVLSRESKAPVTTGSFFEAASTTKMLVAATAMMLVQEGKGLVVMTNGVIGSRRAMEVLAAVAREYQCPE
jgi:hypothetical protein